MLDANQAYSEYYTNALIKKYSIEWLCTQRGMDDPFVQLAQSRPNSTMTTPNRDIDYVLTFGINVRAISTMQPDFPCRKLESSLD